MRCIALLWKGDLFVDNKNYLPLNYKIKAILL